MYFVSLVLGAAALVCAALGVITGFKMKGGEPQFNLPKLVAGIGAALVIMVVYSAFGQVPAGERGVVLRFGGVTNRVLPEGLHVITPFVETVQHMDVRVKASAFNSQAASKDLQDVATTVTVNWHYDPGNVQKVWQQLHDDAETRVIAPSVQEAVKSTTAMYDAEKLITERAAVRDAIEKRIIGRMQTYNVIVDAVSLTDFKFSEQFTQAIEAKVVATQRALQAENDLRRIKVEATQRIETAKAEAEAIRIQAQAIQAQGGVEYVSLKAIEKWDGTLPQIMGGGTTPFINLDLKKRQ